MRIASLLIRSHPGSGEQVKQALLAMGEIEVVEQLDDDFAVVLQTESVSAQKAKHAQIQGLPQVQEARLVFLTSEV